MTYAELFSELKTLGMPVAYHSFSEKQSLPFITIDSTNNNDLIADNQNYVDVEGYQIELYTAIKHPSTEKIIQDKLKALKLPYFKTGPTKIEGEELFQTVYEISLI